MWCSFAVAGMTQVDFCFGTGRKSAAFLHVPVNTRVTTKDITRTISSEPITRLYGNSSCVSMSKVQHRQVAQ